jgi:hypothetical protein
MTIMEYRISGKNLEGNDERRVEFILYSSSTVCRDFVLVTNVGL